MNKTFPAPRWHVYIVRTRDGTLYTGITIDVERRLAEQGFGPRLKSTADDVLARLNAKRTQPA